MKLGTQVGLGPGHIVLDGHPAPPRKAAQQNEQTPHFSVHFALARSPISATAELLYSLRFKLFTGRETIKRHYPVRFTTN